MLITDFLSLFSIDKRIFVDVFVTFHWLTELAVLFVSSFRLPKSPVKPHYRRIYYSWILGRGEKNEVAIDIEIYGSHFASF